MNYVHSSGILSSAVVVNRDIINSGSALKRLVVHLDNMNRTGTAALMRKNLEMVSYLFDYSRADFPNPQRLILHIIAAKWLPQRSSIAFAYP
jgi:hypothetical protein